MIKVNSAGCLFVWVLVLFLAGSLSSGGFSQDRAGSRESTVIPDKMTLRQCMEYAVEHSARVKVAQADLSAGLALFDGFQAVNNMKFR